jgi:hypothetical protein
MTSERVGSQAGPPPPIHIHVEPYRGWMPLELAEPWAYR